MPIYKGSANQSLVYKGNSVITNVYKGSTLVYRLGFDPVTFTENGTWTVPAGIKQIRVDCVATQGYGVQWAGGLGGRVQCILNVTPKQTLFIKVYPYSRYTTDSSTIPYGPEFRTARYNAADIRIDVDDLNHRVVVAGGGGNMPNRSEDAPTQAGHGGGLVGTDGVFARGRCYGGTQTAGGGWTAHNHSTGVARRGGFNGTFGLGGNGGGSALYGEGGGGWTGDVAAGAGGAGWYGGGGGQASEYYGRIWGTPGGGGSSYTHPSLCSEVVHTQGYRAGSGYVTISMV